jgi:hypothetical protein
MTALELLNINSDSKNSSTDNKQQTKGLLLKLNNTIQSQQQQQQRTLLKEKSNKTTKYHFVECENRSTTTTTVTKPTVRPLSKHQSSNIQILIAETAVTTPPQSPVSVVETVDSVNDTDTTFSTLTTTTPTPTPTIDLHHHLTRTGLVSPPSISSDESLKIKNHHTPMTSSDSPSKLDLNKKGASKKQLTNNEMSKKDNKTSKEADGEEEEEDDDGDSNHKSKSRSNRKDQVALTLKDLIDVIVRNDNLNNEYKHNEPLTVSTLASTSSNILINHQIQTPPYSAPPSFVSIAPNDRDNGDNINKQQSMRSQRISSLRERVNSNHERLRENLQTSFIQLRAIQNECFHHHVQKQLNKILELKQTNLEQQQQQQQHQIKKETKQHSSLIDDNSVELLTNIIKSKLNNETKTEDKEEKIKNNLLQDVNYELQKNVDETMQTYDELLTDYSDDDDIDDNITNNNNNNHHHHQQQSKKDNADLYWQMKRVQLGSEWQRVQIKMKRLADKKKQCNKYVRAFNLAKRREMEREIEERQSQFQSNQNDSTSNSAIKKQKTNYYEAAAIAALSTSLQESVAPLSSSHGNLLLIFYLSFDFK